MRPITLPRTVTSSARISPWISAFSPITKPTLRTSPSTWPSIWISPVDVNVPLTIRSALMIEGAAEDRPSGRLGAGAGAAFIIGMAGGESLDLLENMAACLDEIAGVAHDIVEPNFVMNMRPGGAPGRTDPAQGRALVDPRAQFHGDGRQMAIAGADAETVIHFHHIAIGAAIAGEHHGAGCGGLDPRAPGTGEIDAGMKGIAAGKGIDTRTEAAAAVELCAAHRGDQRNMAHFLVKSAELIQHGTGTQIGGAEAGIVDAFN